MNHRKHGILDPLIQAMPHKLVNELAKKAEVSRNTVLRWQKNPATISPFNILKLTLLAKTHGVVIDFRVTDGDGKVVEVGAQTKPSDRYTCTACGEKGHRSSYCPKLQAVKNKKGKRGKRS